MYYLLFIITVQPSKTDEELLLIDTITRDTGVIGIIVYQLPNCPIVYVPPWLPCPADTIAHQLPNCPSMF